MQVHTGRIHHMWELMDARVGLLMTTNLGGAVANNMVSKADSVLHLLVSAGQVGVAIVTIVYIVKKIKDLPRKKKDESTD